MRDQITGTENVLDSRDIIDRLDSLTREREDLVSKVGDRDLDAAEAQEEISVLLIEIEAARELIDEATTVDGTVDVELVLQLERIQSKLKEAHLALRKAEEALGEAIDALEDWDGDYFEELTYLTKVNDEGEVYSDDWSYGATLISDDYFEDYAQDTAEGMGLIPRNAGWPANCIDWERAAEELKVDYTSIEVNGNDYWVR